MNSDFQLNVPETQLHIGFLGTTAQEGHHSHFRSKLHRYLHHLSYSYSPIGFLSPLSNAVELAFCETVLEMRRQRYPFLLKVVESAIDYSFSYPDIVRTHRQSLLEYPDVSILFAPTPSRDKADNEIWIARTVLARASLLITLRSSHNDCSQALLHSITEFAKAHPIKEFTISAREEMTIYP